MESSDLQQVFFNTVKNAIPVHLSLVDEVAAVLHLSYDSVYRRIRGEKPITLSELKLLCDHFHISLDQVLQIQSEAVVFHAAGINDGEQEFKSYITGILQQLKYFNSFREKEMMYFCKDLPIWHFYTYPEIAAFKTFCWIKTFQNHPDYQNKTFSLAGFPFDDLYRIGQQVLQEYCRMPSVELWNMVSLNSSILQLKYYKDADMFDNEEDFRAVLDSLDKTLDHFQNQAEKGLKFMPGATDLGFQSPFRLYVNEVILGNNTILVEMDGHRQCFINYNVLHYLMTKDQRFNDKAFNNFQNVLTRSTMISGTGEKYRNKFFRELRQKVRELRS
ncbi:MAG: hypothetical protein ACJ75B_15740 [Flavisolibacter sp.]|jgi:hypothetical protein